MIDKAGLIDLWDEIRSYWAYKHLRTETTQLVPGVGAERPWAFVVGQNPGAEENRVGLPFVGASGRALHMLMDIARMYAYPSPPGLDLAGTVRPNVWLTNVVKYMTPGNRALTSGEIIHATELLRREYKLVGSPKLIVAVGSAAAEALGFVPITNRGSLFPRGGGTYGCVQYHPAYGLRGDDRVKDRIERQWQNMAQEIEEMRDELQAYDR